VHDRKYELSDDERVMQFQNMSIYDRNKDSTLYKDYPSPTRTEFSKMAGEKYSFLRRQKVDENAINSDNYESLKHTGAFGETYADTLNSLRKIVDHQEVNKFS